MTSGTAQWIEAAGLLREQFRDEVGPVIYHRHTEAFDSIVDGWRAEGIDITDPAVRRGMMAGLAYGLASAYGAHESDKSPWAILTQISDTLARVSDMTEENR